jgi:hypothetical protein
LDALPGQEVQKGAGALPEKECQIGDQKNRPRLDSPVIGTAFLKLPGSLPPSYPDAMNHRKGSRDYGPRAVLGLV